VTVAALLKQAAEFRLVSLQHGERRQRIGDAAEIALADRDHVEHVAVLRHLAAQRLRRRQRRIIVTALHQLPDAQYLSFNR
jgi:hypothetical protein